MHRIARRMTLSYALLAFVMLLALEGAIAAIALVFVDRGISDDTEAVAMRARLVASAARADRNGASLGDAAFTIINRLHTPNVDVAVIDTTARTGYRDQLRNGPDGGPGAPGGPGNPFGSIPDRGPPGDGPDSRPGGLPPPPPLARSHESPAALPNPALLALFSVNPVRVAVSGGTILLMPTSARLAGLASIFGIAVALGIVLAFAFALALGRFVSRQALQPLERVVAELQRFGSGDFTLREIAPDASSEFVELALAYNAAGAQVQRAFEERAKATRDMQQFVADAAHELRTPLTIVTGYVDALRSGLEAHEAERVFATIRSESRRMRDLIAKLIVLARLDVPQNKPFQPIDLSHLVEETTDAAAVLLSGNTVRLDVRTGIEVLGDPDTLRDALHNVLTNAAKYAPGATVALSLTTEGVEAHLTVADDGPGMSAEERDNAFARFYRGDGRGEIEGSGLGLPIVRAAIERSGGTVTLESEPGAGARFHITLPLYRTLTPREKPGSITPLGRF